MTTYVYRNGIAVNKETGEPMLSEAEKARPPSLPMILDFKPYACPVTGKEISTPDQHRANLKKHNCVEAKEIMPSATNGEIRNERFARKHGLTVSDRYRDEPWKPKEKK